jgi:hypothetical protein
MTYLFIVFIFGISAYQPMPLLCRNASGVPLVFVILFLLESWNFEDVRYIIVLFVMSLLLSVFRVVVTCRLS